MTNTCNGARLAGRILAEDHRFPHAFPILYDSYGLQLLAKDLLECEPFSIYAFYVSQIVTFFRASKLQLSRLRTYMTQTGTGKIHTILVSVITRWGSQYRFIQAVSRAKPALFQFSYEARFNNWTDERIDRISGTT